MKEKGYIKLSRKFFSHRMWEAARTFSECEAWLDLIQSARFDATPLKESIGGREIKYGRGQFPASIRFLAKRWNWGEQKVKSFISKLKKEKMITTDTKQGLNIITLCKYDEYNANNTVNNSTNNTDINLIINELKEQITQLSTQLITQPQPSCNPNYKKEEEYKEISNTPNGVSDTKKKSAYESYIDWQKENCLLVSQMDKQISEKELDKMMDKYTAEQIKHVIQNMENSKGNNNKPIHKRYISVYQTFLNWAKKEYGN